MKIASGGHPAPPNSLPPAAIPPQSPILATVECFAAGGHGLCRTSSGVIFARGAIPGEEIEIVRIERKRGVGWAREWRLITPSPVNPSPDRIEPACRHFPLCGGCDFQHLSYERELEAKREITANTLRRISGMDVPVEGPFTPQGGRRPLGYRNTIRIQGGAGYLGYCEKESNSIVDIEDCPISMDAIREAIPRAKDRARTDPPRSVTFRVGTADREGTTPAISIVTTSQGRTEIGRFSSEQPLPAGDGDHDGSVWIRLLDRPYRVGPRSFFQVNTEVASVLIGDLRRLLPPARRLIDLFAGVGAFAIALADRFERVEACEVGRAALDDFRVNAEGLSNITIREWDAARGLFSAGGLKKPPGPDDIIVVDPPRVGLPERLTADLSRSTPAALAYISCDPATLARDLKALVAAGYALDGPVRLYDMFPRTAHVESLAILKRR